MGPASADPAQDFESQLEACRLAAREGRHADGLPLARAVQAASLVGSLPWCEAGRFRALHALRLGELDESLATGLALVEELGRQGEQRLRTQALVVLVLVCEQSGRFPDALRHANEAWRLAQQSGDAVLKSWALNRLGSVHRDLGDDAEGHRLLHEALRLAREAGDAQAEFAALNNLGSQLNWRALACGVQRQALQPDQALASLREAHAVALKLGNHDSNAICLTNMAWALRENGALAESSQCAANARALADTHGLRQVRMHSRIESALTGLEMGEVEAAARWLEEAALLRHAGDRWGQLALERALSLVLRACGQPEGALQAFQRYHELALEEVRRRSHLHLEVERRQHALELSEVKSRRAALEAEMQRLRAEQLRRQAHEDALTGLYNRHFVDEQLPLLRQRAEQRARPLMALLCDADHFKAVNDGFGHRVGDQVLRQIGLMLLHSIRVSDLAARWGGEEMLLLMPDTEPKVAVEVAERLRREVASQPWGELAPGLRVTISIGVAAVPPDNNQDPLGAADAALYRAKRAGRNRVVLDQWLEEEGLK